MQRRESSQVAPMPPYKERESEREREMGRPSGGGGACVQNAHSCRARGDRGCKAAGRRVLPGGRAPNLTTNGGVDRHFAGIRPRLAPRREREEAQFGVVLSGLAFDSPSLPFFRELLLRVSEV